MRGPYLFFCYTSEDFIRWGAVWLHPWKKKTFFLVEASKVSESTRNVFKMILLDQEMNFKKIKKNPIRKNIFFVRIFFSIFLIFSLKIGNFRNFRNYRISMKKSKFSKNIFEFFKKYFCPEKTFFRSVFRSDFFKVHLLVKENHFKEIRSWFRQFGGTKTWGQTNSSLWTAKIENLERLYVWSSRIFRMVHFENLVKKSKFGR